MKPDKTINDFEIQWDAVVIGSGIGGLVTATQLAAKGAKVLVLESYTIPGGSSGAFHREGYTFDVGASMIFGFGKEGYTNLLTRALADVDKKCETIPDPVQLAYHLPDGFELAVDRNYDQFITDLISRFPHEANGIEFAATYGLMLFLLVCLGGGKYLSLDYWVSSKK